MSITNLIGQYSGIGAVPVGVILPWVSGYFTAGSNTGHTPVLASADTIAAANAYLNPIGYYVCDGSAVNVTGSPVWNAAGRYIPNLTDSRFLMGSTSVSAAANGGSNVMADHKHANTNLSVVGEALHTHAVGTYTNTAELSHTHGVGTYGNTAEASHTHNWGGNWSNDNATSYTAPYGDGTQNTYSDGIAGINAWGSGSYAERATGTASADHSHGSGTLDVYCAGGSVTQGQGGYAGNFWDLSITAWPYNNSGDRDITIGGDTGGMSANHTHQYYLPSHRHWIQVRASAAGSSHNHVFSGTSAAGSSHTHPITGASAAGSSHTHTLSGVIGSGSVDPVAGTIENRPQYMKCFMIIRVL